MINRLGTVILLLMIVLSGGPHFAESPESTQQIDWKSGLQPNEETGAVRFLADFPEYDGRNVVVAILDTGVDPGAPGLFTTPQGENKFLDFIDATGDGDVETKEVRESVEGILIGVTGRKLTVNPEWTNPTGKFRVGLKAAYDLFPEELVERVRAERRKQWDESQRARLQELQNAIDSTADGLPPKKEREARLTVLKSAQDAYQDPGPAYDCVLFHDGTVWRAVVDTDEDGDLRNETVMTDYDVEPAFATFGANSSLNFTVHIYNGGDTLSLVTVSGDHGTHVAGIVGAYEPEHPDRNGVAPGAKMVSIKIGDNRLGGMETGTALTRVVPAVLKHHCDLINMSYGEPSAPANLGRVVEHFSSLVREHNVLFVASAGNSGPALSTVGSPGGTSTALIGVGAYISPAMMQSEYTLREEIPETAYTWTSRGPTPDGDFGVDIFAPGGAIAPVPNYSLQPARQMNGTSMASPNACGNMALILSGLKAVERSWTSQSVLRALQYTAQPIETADVFAQGPGLLQVDKAFAYLTAENTNPAETVEVDVAIAGGGRGIYLREPWDSSRAWERTITLKPRFTDSATNADKIGYEIPLRLEATADWVDVGPLMILPHDGRPMSVWVDPTNLEPGVHTAEVRGFDERFPERGPLVRIPVTVVRPETPEGGHLTWNAATGPGQTVRQFIAVPPQAVSATLKVKRLAGDTTRFGFLHAVQLAPGQTFEKAMQEWVVRLDGDEVFEEDFSVIAGRTLELCWGQYFSSLGTGEFEFDLQFHGLQISDDRLQLSPGLPPQRLDITAFLAPAAIDLQGEVHTRRRLIAPEKTSNKVSQDDRDGLPNNHRTRILTLEYPLEFDQKTSVTLRFPALEGLLYESPLDGIFLSVIDEHQAVTAVQDQFAEEETSIPAGKSLVRVELKHTSSEVLKKWEGLVLAVDQPLSNSLALPLGNSPAELAGGQQHAPVVELQSGDQTSLWIGCPKLSGSGAAPGELLLGEVTFSDHTPGFSIPVTVSISPGKEEAPADTKQSASLDASKSAADALLEFKLERLAALEYPKHKEEIDLLTADLEAAQPNSRRLAVALLHLVDTEEHREKHLSEVVAAANKVIKLVPVGKVQAYFGQRQNPESEAEKKLQKERTAEKADLIDALHRKARALLFMELPEVVAEHPIADPAKLDADIQAVLKQLEKWVDLEEAPYALLKIRSLRRKELYGQAIELLRKDLHRDGQDDWQHHKKLHDMYQALGWDDWAGYEARWMLRRFPGEHDE